MSSGFKEEIINLDLLNMVGLFLEVGKTPPCNVIVMEEHRASCQGVNVAYSDVLIFIYVFIV
jgi:hypothetical protein